MYFMKASLCPMNNPMEVSPAKAALAPAFFPEVGLITEHGGRLE